MEALYVRQAIIPTFFRRGQVFVIIVWQSIHSRSDTNRTGAECLSFYYPRLLYCPYHMLAVMLLSQHRVYSLRKISYIPMIKIKILRLTFRVESKLTPWGVEDINKPFGDLVGDTAKRYRLINFWLPHGFHWLWDCDHKHSSPNLKNFESAQSERKEVS